MRRLALALFVGCVLFASACGSDDAPAAGKLVVTQDRSPDRPLGIEGSASYASVRQGSTQLATGKATGSEAMGTVALFSRELEPGEYRVVAFQRFCEADACMSGAPHGRPVARCSEAVTVEAGKTIAAIVHLRPVGRGSCDIDVSTQGKT